MKRINPFEMPEPGESLITPMVPLRTSHGPLLTRSEAFNEMPSSINYELFFHSAPAKLDGTEPPEIMIPGHHHMSSPYLKDLIIGRLERQPTPSADMSQTSGHHFLK